MVCFTGKHQADISASHTAVISYNMLKSSPIHVMFHRPWTPSQQRRTPPLYSLYPSTFSPTSWRLMKLHPNSKYMILFFSTDIEAQFVTNIHGWGNTRCARTNAVFFGNAYWKWFTKCENIFLSVSLHKLISIVEFKLSFMFIHKFKTVKWLNPCFQLVFQLTLMSQHSHVFSNYIFVVVVTLWQIRLVNQRGMLKDFTVLSVSILLYIDV